MQRKTKARKKREELTAKVRKATLFRYRIIITMPPWGVLVMGGAVAFGLLTKPMLLTNIVSVACVLIAVALVVGMRRIVKSMRFEMHEILNGIGNEDLPASPVDEDLEVLRLKKLDNRVNGHGSSRVSE